MNIEVAVVGAGPVGLVAALALEKQGVSVVVIESEPDQNRAEWRGSTLHAPTLEIFDELGISEPILASGVRLSKMVYRDLEIKDEAIFPYKYLEGHTKFPFRMQYEQYKVLRHLKDALAERGIPILFEHTLKSFSQNGGGVMLKLVSGGEESELSANWLLGADGAHSVVRKQLGIKFPGFTYPTQSLVVATDFPFENYVDSLPPVSYWSGPRGRVSVIRTPDIWRVALTTNLGADETYEYSGDNPHPSFVDGMNLLLKGKVNPYTIKLQQHQFYRSHQRLAEKFKVGKVLLAGDSAHLSSTTGGMGLNSGVHDAYQFAKAFAQADRDQALNTYALGRRNASEKLIQPLTTKSRFGTDLLDEQSRKQRIVYLQEIAADEKEAHDYIFSSAMMDASGLEGG